MTEALAGRQILVTGGAGFIGAHLVARLVDLGARVRVLDNLSTGHREHLVPRGGTTGGRSATAVELMVGDVRDPAACERAAENVEVIFHQAAIGSVARSMEEPAATVAVNVAGTANVFSAARRAGVQRVVYASSSSVFGDTAESPLREGAEGTPRSIYALSKRMGEDLAECHARSFGMTLIGLRYFNVFGPHQASAGTEAAVVPSFFRACRRGEAPTIFGDGSQTRDFIDVRDVVRANVLAATAPVEGALAVNVASGVPTTIAELAKRIATLVGHPELAARHTTARPGDLRHSRGDTRKALESIGFLAEHSLEEGLVHLGRLD